MIRRPVSVDALTPRLSEVRAASRRTVDQRVVEIAEGVPFYRAMSDRGLIGRQIRPGVFQCICPNEEAHSKPEKDPNADTSTVLGLPYFEGRQRPLLMCSHEHCAGLSQEDFQAMVGLARAAIDIAEGFTDLTACEGDVVLMSATAYEPKPISWLWQWWFARGKLTILAGAPGQGKTTISIALTARVSTGGEWPDGTPCPKGKVVIWTGEDDPADTLVPRLIAHGADLSMIVFVSGVYRAGAVASFNPAQDFRNLTAAIRKAGDVALVVVDPIVSAVSGDGHSNTDVRRSMQPVVDLAAEIGCAVVGITHLSKGTQGRDPAERVTGSIAFTAVARVVILAMKVADRRVLVRAKSNIGPDGGGVEYDLQQVEVLPGINASRVVWGASLDGDARDLLEPEAEKPARASKAEQRIEWLRAVLTRGPVSVPELKHEAAVAGYGWSSVEQTAALLGVAKQKHGAGAGSYSTWALPNVDDLFSHPSETRE